MTGVDPPRVSRTCRFLGWLLPFHSQSVDPGERPVDSGYPSNDVPFLYSAPVSTIKAVLRVITKDEVLVRTEQKFIGASGQKRVGGACKLEASVPVGFS